MNDAWLPEVLSEENCDTQSRYAHFRRDYIESPPSNFAPKAFRVDDTIREDGKEEAFFHLTTTGGENRKHDPYRCGRIEWGKPVIERTDSRDIVTWRVRQKGENRIKMALQDFTYLVVVAEDNEAVRLVTAFYVHAQSQRVKIEKEAKEAGGESAVAPVSTSP